MYTTIQSCAYLFVTAAFISEINASADEPTSTLESQASYVASFKGKPRVFVLTDIGNEPDDQMSLTRFLLYSNDFDVEGLVAVTSTWQRKKVSPEIIQKVLSNYGKIRSNLLKHANGFPALEDSSHVIKPGQPACGMAGFLPRKSQFKRYGDRCRWKTIYIRSSNNLAMAESVSA